MSRTMSLNLREALQMQETGEVLVCLILIDHEDLATPFRFSTDPTARITTDPLVYGTVSNGETFYFRPAKIQLPDDSDERPPAMRLILDNIERETAVLLRSTTVPAEVSIDIVRASDPDTIEVSLPTFDLIQANIAAETIALDLTIEALQSEPFPAGSFTPAGFGGLF